MINRIHKTELIAGASFSVLALSALLLSSPSSFAANTGSFTVGVFVQSSCTMNIDDNNHTATINPGTSSLIGTSAFQVICNDSNGFSVYSVGYSDDTIGNNTLISTTDSASTIASNALSSPFASQWNMTLSAVSGDYAPTIMNQTTGDNPVGNFTIPHTIPTVYTKVAYRNSYTDSGNNATGANFNASFNAYIASNQIPGTYQGKVKFLLVHPNSPNPDANTFF